MYKRLIIICFTFVFVNIASAGERLLSLRDVRTTLEEMFSYHVESKKFSPLIARRSTRLFVEQFDFYRSYLLKSEVDPFFALNDQTIDTIIAEYREGKYFFYEALNEQFYSAIKRNQKLRKKISRQLIAQAPTILTLPSKIDQRGYPKTEAALEQLIYEQLLYRVQTTLERREIEHPTRGVVEKILSYDEKKRRELEAPYLGKNGLGKNGKKADHFLALHLLKALAKSLDAHSGYYSPAEAYRIRVSLQKQFSGIGIVLKEDFDAVYISELVGGGPAERSGQIEAGDRLVAINAQTVEGLTFEEILDRLTGDAGALLILELKRGEGKEEKTVEVSLTREKIVMNDERLSVTSEPFGDGVIGKINLPAFYDNGQEISVKKDLQAALLKLQQQGNLLGLVIDLRENAGGFLQQAIRVSKLFVQSGVIVVSKYARNEVNYAANLSGRKAYGGPLVLLASKASASAAEIVAQALQDHGVALIVGDTRSYGKGSMQHQTITDPNANRFFKVTVGRYYTASGRSPQIQGVEADIVVPTRYFPYRIGERYLSFPLANDHLSRDLFQALRRAKTRPEGALSHLIVPYLQPRLSKWRKILPQLTSNSRKRIDSDPDFQLFLKKGKRGGGTGQGLLWLPSSNVGVEDLQLKEAVAIVKDMILIQQGQGISP